MKMWSRKLISKFKIINLLSISIFLFLLSSGFIFCFKAYSQDSHETPLSGKELFLKNRCVNCHTIGRGRFVGPDLSGIATRYSRDDIVRWMENPQLIYESKGRMPVNEGYPPMPPLSVPPGEAELIADYLLTFKIPSISKAEGGKIKGRVFKAAGGELTENVELILKVYLGDRATDEKSVRAMKDGSFVFNNLGWDRGYTISLNYRGAEYVTDKMVFSPEEETKTINLPIYEPTESDRDISVKADHMVIQISEKQISVAEIMVLHNDSQEIYLGKEGKNGGRETLRFDLPDGASNVQFLDGLLTENVIQSAGGFIDTSGFPPGIRRVVYAYTLSYKTGKNIIEKYLRYRTDGFVLLVSDSEASVSVDELRGGDTVDINNERFLRWIGSDFKPETKITIEISKPFLTENWTKWLALGIVLMLLGAAVLYSLILRDGIKLHKKGEGKTSEAEDLEKARKNLVRLIAQLDDSFHAKEIKEEDYRKERFWRKEKLLEITKKIKKK